jgi:hypothetical protein
LVNPNLPPRKQPLAAFSAQQVALERNPSKRAFLAALLLLNQNQPAAFLEP